MLLAASALGSAGCAHRPRLGTPPFALEAGERPRIVVLPMENLSAVVAPMKELQAAVVAEIGRKIEIVSGDALEPFLARHRFRHTGGVDTEMARAAREELHASAILVTTLELYRPSTPPAIGFTMRLVSVEDEPVILWMDAAARSGDEAPGLLRLGLVDTLKPLQDRILRQLSGSLTVFVGGQGAPKPACGGAWYAPKIRYRSRLLDAADRLTLAVIPFLNQSGRRGAGDAMALEFVRHLVATDRFRVLEPGIVREYLLRARVMMPGGISLETTRLMLGALGVDLVLSGAVLDFTDSAGTQGPTVRFSATMLDGGSGEIVWHSSSYNRGDDGVFAFGLGRVRTSGELSCRMVSDVMSAIVRRGANTPTVPEDERRGGEFSTVRNRSRRDASGVGGK